MEQLNSLFKLAAKAKNFMNRAFSYIGMLNSFLIILTFKKVYEIPIHSFVIVAVGGLLMLIIGYLDYRFILKHEFEHLNQTNDLKHDLRELKQLIKENNK